MGADFEAAHPRHPKGSPQGGRFRPKRGRGREPAGRHPKAPAPPAKPAARLTLDDVVGRLRRIGDDDLAVAWVRISAEPANRPGRREAVAALDAELARREGVARLQVDDRVGSRHLDELVGRGWSYTEAYAEVHGLDPSRLDAQERAALVDGQRLPGERRAQTLRRMYAEQVYLQYLVAEEETRGHVLNAAGRAKGIDPASLWSGQTARARKYASDELKQWWEAHGGRQTWVQFRAQYVSGQRATAQAGRQAGAGRDYGL